MLTGLSPSPLIAPLRALGAPRRILGTAASVALLVGLATISWERFANVSLGPYNVKLPSMAFSVSALLALPLLPRLRRLAASRLTLALASVLGLLAVYLTVRSLFSSDVKAALPQIAALATGAVAPGLAVLLLCTSLGAVVTAMRWFVLGAVVASAYGIYQLTAFYLGLPQGIEYRGVGTDGLVGRISALSYEPAYFAYFLILALGLTFTLEILAPARAHRVLIVFFALTLTLANVRALVFVAPLLIVLLAIRTRRYPRAMAALLAAAVVCVLLTVAMPGAVGALRASQSQTQTQTPSTDGGATTTATAAPTDSASPVPAERRQDPNPGLLDPNEPSSNAPRLSVYRTVLGVAEHQLVVGVGLGNLQRELQAVSPPPPNIDLSKPVVANNIWLQALVDGGVLAVLLQLGAVVLMCLMLLARKAVAFFPAAAAWLSVIAVGGMLTSYFLDVKIWVVAALVLAGACALDRHAGDRRLVESTTRG